MADCSSGHGGQTEDVNGDEDDGFDEVIYPVDFKQAGQIVDDERKYIVEVNLIMQCTRSWSGHYRLDVD